MDDADDPLTPEQRFERFNLSAITENVETTRKLRALFETVPVSERHDVISPFTRPNFSEALNAKGGLLVCLSDGAPIACLMIYPYEVRLADAPRDPHNSKVPTGNYYELGSIYVAPDFRRYQLAEFLVAFAALRQFLMNPEVWLHRIFAVSFPYQHPVQRADDPTIPTSRGGMAHIFSARHLGFEPTTPPDKLLEVREAKGMINTLTKIWWFAGDFVLEQTAAFLDGVRHASRPNIFVLGRKKKAWLDCSALGELPEGSFAKLIEDPSEDPGGRGD